MKFAFLRSVAGKTANLGMAWYYLPGHDGRPDGRHTEYLEEPIWAQLDQALFAVLSKLPKRGVQCLETLDIWPKSTRFHRSPVGEPTREEWVDNLVRHLGQSDFVFLDPDNGLGMHPKKHARPNDLRLLARRDRALAIIKFPGR